MFRIKLTWYLMFLLLRTKTTSLYNSKRDISSKLYEKLINILKDRFTKNMYRHDGLDWDKIQAKLEVNNEILYSLNEMEISSREPDVVGQDMKSSEYIFCDCSVLLVAEMFVTLIYIRGEKGV